jgi:hypothetical protein
MIVCDDYVISTQRNYEYYFSFVQLCSEITCSYLFITLYFLIYAYLFV